MKVILHGFDRAELEVEANELALVSDLLGQFLGYQKSSPGPPDQGVADLLESLYSAINAALAQISSENELRSGPFLLGEPVVRILDPSGARLPEPRSGTVVADHPEDEAHDYPWTTVQITDGSIAEVPTHHLRRAD